MKLYTPGEILDSGYDLLEDNFFSDWLYGEWDERKYKLYLTLNEFPVIRNYMDYLLSRRADKEYMHRYGMGYSDIHDPRKLQTRSGIYFSTLEWVSDNLEKLYK